jgi:putative glutamate/gamma-aminobutyrate antiporter
MQVNTKGKVLSVFTLMMINVIAVDSLRTLPISAEYGSSLIFYYVVAAVCFFIPTALVTAELATGWPNTGGAYVWVTKAFGPKIGFLTIWLQWIYNVVWYPTILAFLAGTFAALIDPSLATNTTYTLSVILILFWASTFLSCMGLQISSRFSVVGAVVGTMIPMLVIVSLGILWVEHGHLSKIHFDRADLFPHLNNVNNLGYLVAVLFGLMGMEMSAVHAGDVKNPQKDYPKALLYSSLIILVTLIGGSLAIAVVIPPSQISLVSSLVDAYAIFFKTYHLVWAVPAMVAMIFISGLANMSAWVIGPTRGLWVAAEEGNVPKYFAKLNKHGMPARILILQAVIVTLLCAVFLLMPSVNSSYWILTALTSQLALLFYIFMFAAVVRLRYRSPEVQRSYKIPGGNWGVWIVAGVGILTSISVILLGFLPPSNLHIASVRTYELILVGGILLFALPPLLIHRNKK